MSVKNLVRLKFFIYTTFILIVFVDMVFGQQNEFLPAQLLETYQQKKSTFSEVCAPGMIPGVQCPVSPGSQKGPSLIPPQSVSTPFYSTNPLVQGMKVPVQPVNQTALSEVSVSSVSENASLKVNTSPSGTRLSGKSGEILNVEDYVKILQQAGNVKEPEVLENLYFKITPEKRYMLNLSSVDVNRIYCPYGVRSVVYSEERNIIVRHDDNNIFIKFRIKQTGNDYEFSRTPVDMYIACGNSIYAILAIPSRIPGVTVYLFDPHAENVAKRNFLELPVEKRFVEIVRALYRGNFPEGASYVRKEKKYRLKNGLIAIEKGNYVFEIEGLRARYFEVFIDSIPVERSGGSPREKLKVELDEKLFLDKEITMSPLAITLDRTYLSPGDKGIVILIDRYFMSSEEDQKEKDADHEAFVTKEKK